LSEGLLLVTNDGELAHQLTRAASGIEKTYLVKVAGRPTEPELDQLRAGVPIHREGPGSTKVHTAPARVLEVRQGDNPWYEVVLIEGRNRELRKMFQAVGHHVEKIRRVGYGPLVLDLEPGKLRELEPRELTALRLAAEGKLKAGSPQTGLRLRGGKPGSPQTGLRLRGDKPRRAKATIIPPQETARAARPREFRREPPRGAGNFERRESRDTDRREARGIDRRGQGNFAERGFQSPPQGARPFRAGSGPRGKADWRPRPERFPNQSAAQFPKPFPKRSPNPMKDRFRGEREAPRTGKPPAAGASGQRPPFKRFDQPKKPFNQAPGKSISKASGSGFEARPPRRFDRPPAKNWNQRPQKSWGAGPHSDRGPRPVSRSGPSQPPGPNRRPDFPASSAPNPRAASKGAGGFASRGFSKPGGQGSGNKSRGGKGFGFKSKPGGAGRGGPRPGSRKRG
ncbi:MAG: pseudouridine synthase, partial [Terracidiphilus sp.]